MGLTYGAVSNTVEKWKCDVFVHTGSSCIIDCRLEVLLQDGKERYFATQRLMQTAVLVTALQVLQVNFVSRLKRLRMMLCICSQNQNNPLLVSHHSHLFIGLELIILGQLEILWCKKSDLGINTFIIWLVFSDWVKCLKLLFQLLCAVNNATVTKYKFKLFEVYPFGNCDSKLIITMFKTLEQVALVFIVIWRYFQHYHNISLTMHTLK